jgi:predicted AlkP superfamily phosphohydrolase/phosphomutase
MEHSNLLLSINKTLIDKPHLFAIYDSHPLAKTKDNSPLAVAERQAFAYYILNSAEAVYDYYHFVTKKKDRLDKEVWATWDRTLKSVFTDCTEVRECFEELEGEYEQAFSKYIKGILKDIDKRTYRAS